MLKFEELSKATKTRTDSLNYCDDWVPAQWLQALVGNSENIQTLERNSRGEISLKKYF